MNYLGLDYGTAKIGVAIAIGSLAEPLTTINAKNNLQLLKQIIIDNNIDTIVVGDCSQEFLDRLQLLELPVHVVDETLSSHDAREKLLHTTQKRRKNLEHQVSATIILQNWLDTQ
ncbi:Holliday junction resolvase RuvX [Candidatus Amesbacteria bacterium]|nr:Holliday junction resolvase RuvX [Candidatus Amesbacteria bacterium]